MAREGRAQQCDNPRHWSKPSLWKPGAEKICGMLRLIPRSPIIREYENAALTGVDIKVVLLKCELHTNNGFVAAEGTGARALRQDNGDINKSLKMAEKSAHTDATLRVAGLSEIFTQDIEDMIREGAGRPDIQPDNPNPGPSPSQSSQRSQPPRESRPQHQAPPRDHRASDTRATTTPGRTTALPKMARPAAATASPASSTSSSWTC